MTLGELRNLAQSLFGEDSGATKFVDAKIKQSGEDDEVIAHETQVIFLLMEYHKKGYTP